MRMVNQNSALVLLLAAASTISVEAGFALEVRQATSSAVPVVAGNVYPLLLRESLCRRAQF